MALLSTLTLASAAGLFAQTARTADVFARSRQLLVVTTPSSHAIDGRLQRYERRSSRAAWQPVGAAIPIVVGRNGLAWGSGLLAAPAGFSGPVKREGDGRSPEGVFALGTAFGYESAAPDGTRLSYLPLTGATECVDDVASAQYNRIVDRSTTTVDWKSSERMREAGESYRWGIVIDYNRIVATNAGTRPAPGGGSCIFLHVWGGAGHGTAGCTAMAQPEIEQIFRWLDPKRRPLLVQLTVEDYALLLREWRLPAVAGLPQR